MTSFRSTSSEDYTFFAPSDGVTGNIYTAISVAVTGASDFDTFSDAYDEAVKTVADRIEHQIQTTRQKARRQQIVSSAQRKLDDAQDEANEQLDEARSRSTTTGPSWKPTKRHCKIAVPNWRTTGQPLPMANGSSPMDVRRLHRPVNRSRKVASR